jgi:hypothetical protein
MESGAPPRPLSALLSQVLVAYTIEFDNEFERQTGTNLSLVVWSNLMRFLTGEGITIRALADHSLAPVERLKTQLGCLERWGFVVLQPGKRDGWGSARGMKNDWIVRPSERGVRAINTWPSLFDRIGSRWQTRFGTKTLLHLREALQTIADRIEYELPQALPATWLQGESEPYPPRTSKPQPLDLSTLLAQVLLQFRLEFDRESPTALALCANTIRVLSDQPVREADLPLLTGTSIEMCGPGWQLDSYLTVEPGKLLRLSPRGIAAQTIYHRLTAEIEQRWQARYGDKLIGSLRASLLALFKAMPEGLVPPPGVIRAGAIPPALGRRDVGSAARKRARALAVQTEAFLRDPAAALPHYPLWDMNRGFGP